MQLSDLRKLRQMFDEDLEAGKISVTQYDAAVSSIERQIKSEEKKKLREAERFAIGSKRHPNVQGGLPSLGKNSK